MAADDWLDLRVWHTWQSLRAGTRAFAAQNARLIATARGALAARSLAPFLTAAARELAAALVPSAPAPAAPAAGPSWVWEADALRNRQFLDWRDANRAALAMPPPSPRRFG